MIIVSNFMLSFFYQVIYRTIIGTIIGGVILLLKKITKGKLSPNAIHIIWLVFMVALIFPVSIPSRISIYNYVDIDDVKYEGNEEYKDKNIVNLWEKENITIFQKDTVDSTINNSNKMWRRYVEIIIAFSWFIIFIANLVKKMFIYTGISRDAGNDEVKDERMILIVERCKKKLKIKRHIKIIAQDITRMPATIGVFNVKILITDAFLELDDIALSNVFMHELSHYKRKDNIVNFIILIVKSVYWFNPFMKIILKDIRENMEFATDEIAIHKMNLEEQRSYCKVLLQISGGDQLEEQVLGISSTAKAVGKRVEMISFKEKFEENSIVIFLATILIIILLCFTLYPTSYGMFKVPDLYLKLENGDMVEVARIDDKSDSSMKELKLRKDSKVNLVVKNGKPDDHIFYSKVKLDATETAERVSNTSSNKIEYFESGEFIYKFTLTYGNNESIDYAIKIIVE